MCGRNCWLNFSAVEKLNNVVLKYIVCAQNGLDLNDGGGKRKGATNVLNLVSSTVSSSACNPNISYKCKQIDLLLS